MDVKYYSIEINYEGEILKGDCQEFQVAKHPQVRVCIERGRKLPLIFIFYRMAEKEIFWFKLPNMYRESLAKNIAEEILAPLTN